MFVFSIWITKAIKILFYIYFCFACLRFIYFCLLFILNCFDRFEKILDKMSIIYGILYFFFVLFWITIIIITTKNFVDFKSLRKNCPYIIKDLDYNLHIKNRCELYNINNNSRYAYQYICSYNSSKDFKNTFSNEIKDNNVICVSYKNIINNDVINKFINEYKDEEKFLCSRTNIPNDKYVNDKNCSEKQNRYMYAFLILTYIRLLIIFGPVLGACFSDENMRINPNNFILDLSRKSTSVSEKPNSHEDFVRKNTENIIIENKEIFVINTNIKNVKSKNVINNIEELNNDTKRIYVERADTSNNLISQKNQ